MDDATRLSRLDLMKDLATLLVVFGVAGEFLGDWLSRPIAKRLEASRKEEMMRLQASVRDSDARIAEANERTAKLLAQIQPRDLTAAQQNEIVAAIRPFASQGRFIQLLIAGDAEAGRLSQIIDSILDRWNEAHEQRQFFWGRATGRRSNLGQPISKLTVRS